jgi:hypothetical protein
MTIVTVPVVRGGGKTLFADDSAPSAYKLERSRLSGSGVIFRAATHSCRRLCG